MSCSSKIHLCAELREARLKNLLRREIRGIRRVLHENRTRVRQVVDVQIERRPGRPRNAEDFGDAEIELVEPLAVHRAGREQIDRDVGAAREIAFERRPRECQSAIAIVGADGSGERTLASGQGRAQPVWSPDGNLIAYRVVERVRLRDRGVTHRCRERLLDGREVGSKRSENS